MTTTHEITDSGKQRRCGHRYCTHHFCKLYHWLFCWTRYIPPSLIAFVARFALAAVFWKSGQTKIEGLQIDLFSTDWTLGWPHLSDSAISLFEDEYGFPFPAFSAFAGALAEHVFPLLLLFGLGTRLGAFALLIMTLVIQIFVYPFAYPVHLTWITGFLYLLKYGGGKFSLDYLFAHKLLHNNHISYPPLK